MKITLWVMAAILASIVTFLVTVGFGYSHKNGELIGQVKRVETKTNLVCANYDMTSVSLGVLRGGVGSLSTVDIDLWIPDTNHRDHLRKVVATAQLVKIKYDEYRVAFCKPDLVVRGVEEVK